MGNIGRGFLLLRSCLRVLLADPTLLVLTLTSAVLSLLAGAALLLPSIDAARGAIANAGTGTPITPYQPPYPLLIASYMLISFIALFFNTALAAIVLARMQDTRLSIADGIMIAVNHLDTILALTLLLGVAGVLLRMLERSFRPFGGITAALLGATWSVATFLIVPAMLVENAGPLAAVERSIALVRSTWGEQVGARLGLGGAQLVLMIPGAVLALKGIFDATGEARIGWLVGAGVYLVMLALITSTLDQILRAAVYIYATTGQTPDGFGDAGLDLGFGGPPSTPHLP